MRTTILIGSMAVAFLVGAVAHAATPWKVFGTASDRGDYTSAYVSAKVVSPRALAVRVSGPADDVSWTLICQGKTRVLQRAGLSLVAVNKADTCDVSAVAIGNAGNLRVQLLRR